MTAILAGFVEEGGIHGCGILVAELEDVADFDAAAQFQRALAVRAGVAFDDVADVHHFLQFRQVAAEIDAGEVVAVLVGAADEIAHVRPRRGRR